MTHSPLTARDNKVAGTLQTFILAMMLHPHVQAKARAELDGVLGDRLPTYANKDATPYLNAVILETLRWHPVAPMGTVLFLFAWRAQRSTALYRYVFSQVSLTE